MTKEEFDSLSVGGLQKLCSKLTGKLSISNNKPALRKKLGALEWADVKFADIVPPPDPEDEEEPRVKAAAKVTKRKAPVKAAKPAKAPPKKKAAVKAKTKTAATKKQETTDAAKARGERESAIRKIAKPGMSIRKICRAAEAAGIPTARGGKHWSTASVVSILG